MSFQIKRDLLFQIFLCLCMLVTSQSTNTDVLCLKSIKNSLEDPFNYLQSWDFNNKSEGFICTFPGVECWNSDENRVLNLKLSNMGLKGFFPRGIVNCSSLAGLYLSNNEISGTIPSDISNILTYVVVIDLSYNKFTGEVPISFGKCTYLNTLKLNNNMLCGEIPKEVGQLKRIKTISFANNSGLCDKSNDFLQSFKSGIIAGYVFSVTSIVMLTCICMFNSKCAHWMQMKKKIYNHKANEIGKYICSITRRRTRVVVNQAHELLHPQLAQKESKEIFVLLEGLTSTILLEDLQDVTHCFAIDNVIGVGKMGKMYQGILPNGELLAIKRLFDSQRFKKQFLLETMILGRYKHKNIVPLFGFCNEEKERLLAYTYMSNGRLSKWLHPLESEVVRLKWHQRVNIALGIARGLSWLHHSCDLCWWF